MITFLAALSILVGTSQSKPSNAKQNSPASQLSEKTYVLIKPMEVEGDGKVLDGHGATLRGSGAGVGLHIGPYKNVTVKNLKIVGFATDLLAQGSPSLTLVNVTVSGAGSGLRVEKVAGGLIQGIQAHTCATGVQLVGCTKVILEKSDLSQNVQHGAVLSDAARCVVQDNRINSIGEGASGSSDSAGILIDGASTENQVLRNVVAHCKGHGILVKGPSATPQNDGVGNTLQGNDASWVDDGVGFEVDSVGGTNLIDNVAGHCQVGMKLDGATKTALRGNLLVGNLQFGIEDDQGVKNSYETNTFGRDTGGPIAIYLKGKEGDEANTRLFRNTFLDYLKPLIIENSSPCTLQSNIFSGSQSLNINDLAQVTGVKPFALDNSDDKLNSGPFVASLGQIALTPTVFDTVGGVSVAALQKPGSEVVVEGSLSGAFQGEEEVLARYKGDLPAEITFPPRIVSQVRIRGALQGRAAFLALLGDHSMARNMPAEDSEDTLITPGLAVDGDSTSLSHFWAPKSGAAGTWWGVDLKGDHTVSAVAILANVAAPNNFWGKFHVAVSSTGLFRGEETTVVAETNWEKKPGPLRVYRFAPTVARYIRVIGDEDRKDVQLQQFSVYGTGQ